MSINMISISVAAPSHRVPDRDQQEVRHDHYALHRAEHVDHDPGPLPPDRDVELCPQQLEPGLHLRLHDRVCAQDICAAPALFQRALEYI